MLTGDQTAATVRRLKPLIVNLIGEESLANVGTLRAAPTSVKSS